MPPTLTGARRLRSPLCAAVLITLHVLVTLIVPISAHEVVVDQVVEMVVEPRGDRLLVRLHVPLTVVGDANLPRLSNRSLDVANLGDALQIVAADIARNLDLQQGDEILSDPAATARVGADGASVDVELTYASRVDAGRFSARVNAFRSSETPVRTQVRYAMASGLDHTVSVTGPPLRVVFDPLAWDVVRQFGARGLRALLDGGDHLFLLLCVLLPVRRPRSAAALFAAGALGQSIAIAISVLQPPMPVPSLTALAMIAASVVAVAAVQNIVRAHLRWVVPLAFAFGLLNGFAFGNAIVRSQQFAGVHVPLAAAVFVSVVLLGELWLGALAWATRTWLSFRGVSERIVSVLVSVVIIHGAMHRVVDRGQILAQAGSFGAERALVWLTLGWAFVMLLVALAEAWAGRALDSNGRAHAAKAAPAS